MSERRTSFVERIIQRVEEHVEEWRSQDATRKAEAEANREKLWAEAIEREKLLADAIRAEADDRGTIEEIARQQHVAFVVHSEEMARALETFADDKVRLVKVVPGKGTFAGNRIGVTGSWLIFEGSQ